MSGEWAKEIATEVTENAESLTLCDLCVLCG